MVKKLIILVIRLLSDKMNHSAYIIRNTKIKIYSMHVSVCVCVCVNVTVGVLMHVCVSVHVVENDEDGVG